MKFKVFGTEIYVSLLFAAVITIMLATDRTGLLIPALFAVLIHETAHLFAMWLLECQPKKIRLIPTSVQIVRSMNINCTNEIWVALCGPLVNLIVFLTLIVNFFVYDNEMTLYYALINLVVALFNLLPVKGLDGGTIMYNLLCKKLSLSKSMLILRIVSFAIAGIVIASAIYLTVKGKINISLYTIGIYFLIMNLIKM